MNLPKIFRVKHKGNDRSYLGDVFINVSEDDRIVLVKKFSFNNKKPEDYVHSLVKCEWEFDEPGYMILEYLNDGTFELIALDN